MSLWNDLSWVESLRTPFLTIFFEFISSLGYPTFLILFISFGYFYWSPLRFSRIVMMLFISGFINAFFKDFFQDSRPAAEWMLDPKVGTSYGWPSGHAQIAVTLWGLLAYELKNKWVTLGAVVLISLIVFSRLYLGVHDFGDVVGGLVIGGLILFIWHYAYTNEWYERFNKKTWLFLIIIFQIVIYNLYPTHEGHEISIWSLGAMIGWFLGFSNINLISHSVIRKLIMSIVATILVFLFLILTTHLEKSLEDNQISELVWSYGLGMAFSMTVTWVIPRLFKKLRLAV